MATVQQPKRPAQRQSTGKDILSRMLQMEKQSKHQRTTSTSPTLPLSPKADYFGGSDARASSSPTTSPRSPTAIPQSPLRPAPMSRSQTSPDLLLGTKGSDRQAVPTQPAQPLRVSTSRPIEKPKPEEICHSPSWSDHGEKQRKKERKRVDKEQKEREKRQEQEEEKQKASELKSGKRLSKKPPPAAMETQRMPTGIRRNSWISPLSSQSTSGENTRRPSRDEKTLSGLSFGSFSSRRSQSTPATSTEEVSNAANGSEQWSSIVSPSAPKLPSFGWSSRRNSSNSRKLPPGVSDATYDGDIITFAYRLDATAFADPEKKDHSQSRQSPRRSPKKEMQQQQPNISAPSRDSTDPNLASGTEQSTPSRSPQRSPNAEKDNPENEKIRKQERSRDEQTSPTPAAKEIAGSLVATEAEQKYGSGPNPPSPHSRPSHDGGSYVHKQRMYQQQQSIAGFEDQLAVQDANDLAAEYEALLSLPEIPRSERGRTPASSKLDLTNVDQLPEPKKPRSKDTSVSPARSKQRQRSNSPRVELASTKQHSHKTSTLSQDKTHKDHAAEDKAASRIPESMQSTRESLSFSKPQAPTGFKSSRILGFRRRTKEPPALIPVPYSPKEHVLAVQSAPLDITSPTESTEPPGKRSKIERLFRDTKPAFTEEESRRRSSSPARTPAKEGYSKSKQGQSHSRTRTASSTALNDNVQSPISLPRASTEPSLTPTSKPIKSALKVKDSPQSPKSKHNAVESKFERPARKQAIVLVDSKPVNKTAADATCLVRTVRPVFSFEFDEKATNKSMQEVIVESEKGERLIRKASLTRPRSNPQLQTQTTASNSLPSLDFLPELKHQPLVKRERHSPTRSAATDSTSVSIVQFPTPIAPLAYQSSSSSSSSSSEPDLKPDLKFLPRSPLRPSQFPLPNTTTRANRSATEVGTLSFPQTAIAENLGAKPVAKLFVICCKCRFWHDLPSKLYEAMALPMELHKAQTGEGRVAGARLETAVKCPWCEHAMTTSCCQGWTTVVYLHERHH